MAVTETIYAGGMPQIREFVGASTDTKPTVDIPPNSTYWEYDTKTAYVWADGDWRSL